MIKLPAGVNLNSLLLFLKNIGIESSSILREYERNTLPLYSDFDNSKISQDKDAPVTNADLAINQLIIERFAENYQNVNWEIITEENSKAIKFNKSKSDWIWLIDPLDGTKDFIQKTGEYAVHLALNFKNKPFIGIVVLPSLREIWFSVKDLGTWKESEEGPEENKKFKRFSNLKANTIVTSKNHSNEKLEIILKELNLKNIKRMGSIGFKVCSLLRNEADIYISISGKTAPKDWDLAAPNSLINSANCFFTNAAGKELTYNKENYEQKGCLVASTLQESEHFRICKEINKIIKKYNLIN